MPEEPQQIPGPPPADASIPTIAAATSQLNSMLEGDNSLPIAKEKATTMEISWDVANNKVV